jgi:hypothetical protein
VTTCWPSSRASDNYADSPRAHRLEKPARWDRRRRSEQRVGIVATSAQSSYADIGARAVTDVFDFEGSMLQPVERFFRAFGALQTPCLHVNRATPAAHTAIARAPMARHYFH